MKHHIECARQFLEACEESIRTQSARCKAGSSDPKRRLKARSEDARSRDNRDFLQRVFINNLTAELREDFARRVAENVGEGRNRSAAEYEQAILLAGELVGKERGL